MKRALILAGGKGTRLRSVVSHCPKPLAPIEGKPFIEFLLDAWIAQGIEEFYISCGYLFEQFESHFEKGYKNLPVHLIREKTPLGTGGAVLWCLSHLQNKNELIVVLNGDSYIDLDFQKMLQSHQKEKADISLALRKVMVNDRYSGVVLDENRRIIEFAKRSTNSEHLLINAGVYLFCPSLLLESPWESGDSFSIEDDFFPYIIQQKKGVGFVSNGKFLDIGIPKDYQQAPSFFNEQISKK